MVKIVHQRKVSYKYINKKIKHIEYKCIYKR